VGTVEPAKIGIAIAVAILVSACEPLEKVISRAVDKQLSERGNDLEKRVDKLELENIELKNKISSLEFGQQINRIEISSLETRKATLTEGGYGLARTPQTPVFITIAKIEPYLDGYRVALNIGNPSSITFKGIDLEVEWGLPWQSKDRKYAEIAQSRKTKKFSFPRDFLPAAYTQVEVALTPARAEEVKAIEVGIEWNTISLRLPAPQK